MSVFNNWVTECLLAPALSRALGRREGRALLHTGNGAEWAQARTCEHTHAHANTCTPCQWRSCWPEPLVVLSEREILWNTVEKSTNEVEEQQIIKYLRSRRAGRSDRDRGDGGNGTRPF